MNKIKKKKKVFNTSDRFHNEMYQGERNLTKPQQNYYHESSRKIHRKLMI